MDKEKSNLEKALKSIASWRLKVWLKKEHDTCGCDNTKQCLWHRAIRNTEEHKRSVVGLLKLAREVYTSVEKEIGTCACKECLLCKLRYAAGALRHEQHLLDKPQAIRKPFIGAKRYVPGEVCRNGHLLTKETIGKRPDKRKPAGFTLKCLICEKERENRRYRPKKMIPGFCKAGLHRYEGENVAVAADGRRHCIPCKKAWIAEYERRQNPDYKPRATVHCRNGHPRTPENQVPGYDGHYRCKVCRKARKDRLKKPKPLVRYCFSGKHLWIKKNLMTSSNRVFCRLCHNNRTNEFNRKKTQMRLKKRIEELLREHKELTLEDLASRILRGSHTKDQHRTAISNCLHNLLQEHKVFGMHRQSKLVWSLTQEQNTAIQTTAVQG